MIFAQVTVNGISLHEYGTVEKVECTNLSSEILYFEITKHLPHFQGRKKKLKEVLVYLRMIKPERPELIQGIDNVVGLSYSDSPIDFLWNGKYCKAILAEADSELLRRTGLLALKFINLDGLWYGAEKTGSLSISNTGMLETNRATVTITPNSTNVILKDGKGHILTMTALNTTNPITVNMEDKTAMQNGVYIPLSVSSRFFAFGKGSTTMTLTGGTAVTKYREVIAL